MHPSGNYSVMLLFQTKIYENLTEIYNQALQRNRTRWIPCDCHFCQIFGDFCPKYGLFLENLLNGLSCFFNTNCH